MLEKSVFSYLRNYNKLRAIILVQEFGGLFWKRIVNEGDTNGNLMNMNNLNMKPSNDRFAQNFIVLEKNYG